MLLSSRHSSTSTNVRVRVMMIAREATCLPLLSKIFSLNGYVFVCVRVCVCVCVCQINQSLSLSSFLLSQVDALLYFAYCPLFFLCFCITTFTCVFLTFPFSLLAIHYFKLSHPPSSSLLKGSRPSIMYISCGIRLHSSLSIILNGSR